MQASNHEPLGFYPPKLTALAAFYENGPTVLVRVGHSRVFMIPWSHTCACVALFYQAGGGNATVEPALPDIAAAIRSRHSG